MGYDETEPAKHALERAADLASKFGSKLAVTSVAPVLFAAGARGSGPIDPTDPPAIHAEELAHARSFLAGRGLEADFVLPSASRPTRSSSSRTTATRT